MQSSNRDTQWYRPYKKEKYYGETEKYQTNFEIDKFEYNL